MKSQTAFKQFVLGPGKEVTVKTTGSFFFLDSVNGDVSVRFDSGNFSRMISGSEIECAPGDFFTEITFRSDVGAGGATVTGYYYAGTLRVGNRFPVVFTRPAPTYIVFSRQSIAGGAYYDIPETNLRTGQTIADKLVKVRVQNLTVSSFLEVRNPSNGDIVGTLTAAAGGADKEVFDTSVSLRIYANGSAGLFGLMIYYSLPT